jgi:acetolactate synthase-1/2/3 large subunit
MAAEGYSRVTGGIGVINVTSGPGGINALNGVFGAWTDSIPMLVVSGQVKRETCLRYHGLFDLRQLGDQEADIIALAQHITKYAVFVDDPQQIRYHLERALHLATTGRPGPCWLDLPLDVQAAQIDEASLPGYDPGEDPPPWDLQALPGQVAEVLARLRRAERPVILAGTGVDLAGARPLFEEVTRRLGIPVTTGWTAPDLIASEDSLFCGRPGTIGDRGGNFAVQNADVLLVLGSRLNIRQVSYNWGSFARAAFKIQVDADPLELDKPTVRPDLAVLADLRSFLGEMLKAADASDVDPRAHAEWLAWCKRTWERYPVVQERQRSRDGAINPYEFVDRLIRRLADDDIVVCGNGTASVVPFQVAFVRRGQRFFANSGSASMGYDLPAAIGAAFAGGGRRVVCFAGDGSLQMNIQELQTVAHHQLPIKLMVLNNSGYLSIRSTQRNFFGRFVGESASSGVSFPDLVKVAEAYGLPAMRIDQADFEAAIGELLARPGPVVCEVVLDPEQEFEPRSRAKELPDGRIVSPPLEDMYPFLPREELLSNLFIPPAEEE